MRTAFRRARSSLLTILALLALGLAVLPAGTAEAASCIRSRCDGRQPVPTGCTERSYVLQRAPLRAVRDGSGAGQFGSVELWYSPVCQTRWARLVIPTSRLPQSNGKTVRIAEFPGVTTRTTDADVRVITSGMVFTGTRNVRADAVVSFGSGIDELNSLYRGTTIAD